MGSKVTSDAELLAYRELDDALRPIEIVSDVLTDLRLGSNKQHLLVPLLRQSIYSRLAGDEDVNDADRLAVGSSTHHVGSGLCLLVDGTLLLPVECYYRWQNDPEYVYRSTDGGKTWSGPNRCNTGPVFWRVTPTKR